MRASVRQARLTEVRASLSVDAGRRLDELPPHDRERLLAWAVKPWLSRTRRDRASQLETLLLDGAVYSGLAGAGGIRGPMLTMLFGPWDWENGAPVDKG